MKGILFLLSVVLAGMAIFAALIIVVTQETEALSKWVLRPLGLAAVLFFLAWLLN